MDNVNESGLGSFYWVIDKSTNIMNNLSNNSYNNNNYGLTFKCDINILKIATAKAINFSSNPNDKYDKHIYDYKRTKPYQSILSSTMTYNYNHCQQRKFTFDWNLPILSAAYTATQHIYMYIINSNSCQYIVFICLSNIIF